MLVLSHWRGQGHRQGHTGGGRVIEQGHSTGGRVIEQGHTGEGRVMSRVIGRVIQERAGS